MNHANRTVLDHGYVKFIEAWGKGEAGDGALPSGHDYECGIIEAARQSTSGSFRGWDQDQKLLSYLYNSKPQHATPFEFAGLIIEVQAPIFVFREWHRHRTQSYNEMSARYAPLPDLNYIPTLERVMMGAAATTNKQAGAIAGVGPLTEPAAVYFQTALRDSYTQAEFDYQRALQSGVPKELARCFLPVGRYSRMRASANLRNWLAFMTLRFDPGAQWEIQQFAGQVGQILHEVFPRTYGMFYAHRQKGK